MGGAVTKVQSAKDLELPCTLFKKGNQLGGEQELRYVVISGGYLTLYDIGENSPTMEIDLDREINVVNEIVENGGLVTIREGDMVCVIIFSHCETANKWVQTLDEEITVAKLKLSGGSTKGMDRMMTMLASIDSVGDDVSMNDMSPNTYSNNFGNLKTLVAPAMKIVILVVGTRGDVQPFVNIGLFLKDKGHDVRVATHAEYRQDVLKEGLKYYPLAGRYLLLVQQIKR